MKKELTLTEKYDKREKWSKRLRWITPLCFWVCIVLSIVCLVVAIEFSVGNIREITSLLNSKKFTGEQLQANYQFLIDKYGEWMIGNGGAGFTITFVNIGKAVFNAMSIFNMTMAFIFFIGAFVLGKWTLPKLAKSFEQDNQDMTNKATLDMYEKMNKKDN